MTDPLRTTGLHHVSVLAADARRLLPFWTDVLGQRLVKRTVNYDAPTMHHLYVGDGEGDVGATLTFFPIPRAAPATHGTGETTAVAYGVAQDALDAWERRLRDRGVAVVRADRWGRPVLSFRDPEGLPVELVGLADPPAVAGWPAEPVSEPLRLRGFESVTLRLADAGPTLSLLGAMGYRPVDERAEGRARRLRLATDGAPRGTGLEIVEEGRPLPRRDGRGTVHHVAFRLPDEESQRAAQEALRERGLTVSDVRDRDYFRSIYVREPGGVLFEFATDGPGLTVDEPVSALGSALRLPAWAEPNRAAIEAGLPPLGLDDGAAAT
ncbi:MAG: hypothetical protein GVY27_01090, partial [Deinococcus-Thermus bacterium]|nr:hypothetical protein [Deinococcota bacterium]